MTFSHGQRLGVSERPEGVDSTGVIPTKDATHPPELPGMRQHSVAHVNLLNRHNPVRSYYGRPSGDAPAVVNRRPDVLLVLRLSLREVLHLYRDRDAVACYRAELAAGTLVHVEDMPPLEARQPRPRLGVVTIPRPLEVELLLGVPQGHPGME